MPKSQHTPVDVLDYILETEYLDYLENERPEGHVYELASSFRPLVAAAPEMLEALKNLTSNEVCAGISASIRDNDHKNKRDNSYKKALDVIAKAEGTKS